MMLCGKLRCGLQAGGITLTLLCAAAHAADQPYGHADIVLGASFQALDAALDFRDIHAALAAQGKAAKPDLGRRGYGCMRREDAYADVTCVSHDEKIGGTETREIRLHFLNGVLQQFSITAEIQHLDTVMAAVGARYGPPERREPPTAGGFPSWLWRNGVSSIVSYGGKDLVFVSFELATYAEAVRARQSRAGRPGAAEFSVR